MSPPDPSAAREKLQEKCERLGIDYAKVCQLTSVEFDRLTGKRFEEDAEPSAADVTEEELREWEEMLRQDGTGRAAIMRTLIAALRASRGVLASTADRLNTSLRESGCAEIEGSPYSSYAIREGVVSLFIRGARWRSERDASREECARLRAGASRAVHEAHMLGRIYNLMGEPEMPGEVCKRLDAMLAKMLESPDA